ncbi:MmgE/PrpD family protein [Ramlibacter sp.]|uniref:MmgE/PrpD family protein n=1 Tax=Ramlibacter sp. TaxID=1917967 RepID=UPI003D120446
MVATASSTLPDCPPLEQSIVQFVQSLRDDDLDAPARAGLSRLVRDQIALQVGISRMPWSQQLLEYAKANGRPGKSRVAASSLTFAAGDAAFVNGSYGHGFEYDDAHGPSYSHPGSSVIPAGLALGEELGATLGEVMTAIVAGYEVYTRLGVLLAPELLQRGYHPHAVLSNFGAAAVAAKLRGFDAETTLHALSIAASHASGITEFSSTGGSVKRVHAGMGTRNGMTAADLAKAGITGPRAFLSGRKGFFRTFLQRPPADRAEERFAPGTKFEISTVWLKAYCACYCCHAYIDATRPFAPRLADIEKVDLRISPTFNVVVGTANANAFAPKTIEHVQYSLPTQAAFALHGLGNGYRVHRDYMAKKIDMQPLLATIGRMAIVEAPELDEKYPGQFVADVAVTFKNGTTERVFVDNAIGTEKNPMTEDFQDDKFMDLTTDVLGTDRAKALLATLRRLDPNLKASELTALFAA